jgi:hypothetical protein
MWGRTGGKTAGVTGDWFMPVDVNRLRAEGSYESREPIGGLASDLDLVYSLADGWHSARKRLAQFATILLIVGVVALFTYMPAGIVLVALGIWFLYRMKNHPKAVASHMERCEFGKSMAAMLRSDADPKAPVATRLAFNPKQETMSEGPLPNRKNGKQRLYKVSWFSVEAILHDGTTFSETVDDFVRERSFTNPRGKSKSKKRTQRLIAMRFDYPSEIYGDLTPFREKMEKEIQLPEGAAVRGLEISGRAVKVKALLTQTEGSYLAQASTMLALGVYRMLNLSRQIEARKRAQAKKGGAQ